MFEARIPQTSWTNSGMKIPRLVMNFIHKYRATYHNLFVMRHTDNDVIFKFEDENLYAAFCIEVIGLYNHENRN